MPGEKESEESRLVANVRVRNGLFEVCERDALGRYGSSAVRSERGKVSGGFSGAAIPDIVVA